MSIRPISTELQAKAVDKINEVPSKVPEYIESIREWLLQQAHINARTDAQWLIAFLRGCKYDMEASKRRLDRFYTMRTLTPKLYKDRNPFSSELQDIMNAGTCLPLPTLKGGTDSHMWIVRASLIDPSRMTYLLKYMLMLADICYLEEPNFAVTGGTCVVDLADMDERVFREEVLFWKKLLFYICTCYPTRHKGMYYFNAQPSFERALFKVLGNLPFFCKKINETKTAFFYENEFDKLGERINLLKFPREYEGNNIDLKELTVYWKQKVESYRDWFLEDEKYGIIEEKRPGKPITAEEFYADLTQ